MKALVRTLLLVVGALILLIGFFPLAYPLLGDPNGYLRTLDVKWKAQARVSSPRILLVGGSNLALGIDSRLLSQAIGRPVYNLALTGDVGIPFMLNQAVAAARKGDIVIFSPEYEVRKGGIRTLALASLESPSSTRFMTLSPAGWVRLYVQRTQATALACLSRLGLDTRTHSTIYNLHSFNTYGDVITHLGRPPDDIRLRPVVDTTLRDLLPFIQGRIEALNQQGTRTYYLPPPLMDKAWLRDSATYQTLQRQLSTIHQLISLAQPRQMVFTDSLFFDSQDHLGAVARVQRTRLLIGQLASYIPTQKTP